MPFQGRPLKKYLKPRHRLDAAFEETKAEEEYNDALVEYIDEEPPLPLADQGVNVPMEEQGIKRLRAESFETPLALTNGTTPSMSLSNLPSGGTSSTRNIRRKLDMGDSPPDEPMALLRSGEGGAVSQNQAQRVPVIPREPEMGFFTEQRTACLPFTFYCSMNDIQHTTPVVLRIRLNNHYNVLKDTTFVGQTVLQPRVKGVSNDWALYYPNDIDQKNREYLVPFPVSLVGPTPATTTKSSFGTIADENTSPAWRYFYERNWDAYTNYKTEVKVTVINSAESAADLNHVQLLTTTEKYTTGQSNSQLAPTNASVFDAQKWPFFTKRRIQPRNVNTSGSDVTVMNETWTPTSVRNLNVFNDEDIKTWYPTNAQNGDLTECLTIMAYKSDMYPVAPRGSDSSKDTLVSVPAGAVGFEGPYKPPTRPHINLKVELKYYVVYKDLKGTQRYWKAGGENTPLLYANESQQVPITREFVPNTAPNTGAG